MRTPDRSVIVSAPGRRLANVAAAAYPDYPMTSPKPRLTQGPVGRQLVGMTVPVFFGIFMMMLQSFVDMWFIGKVGDRELAALSFGFPITCIQCGC